MTSRGSNSQEIIAPERERPTHSTRFSRGLSLGTGPLKRAQSNDAPGETYGHRCDRTRVPQRLRRGPLDDRGVSPDPGRTPPDGRLLADQPLPLPGDDLPEGQPAAARTPEARSPEDPPPRPLGLRPRPELRLRPPEPADQEGRSRRDLPLRSRPRGAGLAVQRLPRRDLLRGLPRQERGPRRPAEVLQAVLLPRRDRQPLHARDPRLDPRGGRARLLRLARLRRGLRRPRPAGRGHGRRRRGGDRPAGDRLALQQVPQPDPRRRRAPGPPPQRVQDQQPVDPRPDQPQGAGGAVPGVRIHAVLRRGLRAREHAPGDGRDAGALRRGDPRDPGGRPADGRRPAAPVADDRPPQSEGLDRPRARSTATAWRGSGGRTRCRWGTSATTPRT